MLDEGYGYDGLADDKKEYRWECPYTNCKFFLLQYVKEGFEEKISEHRAQHLERMKQERLEREKKLKLQEKKQEKKLSEINKALTGQFDKIVIKDYNKLVLTLYDMNQFETHGIKIDDNCIIEGYENAP